MKQKQNTSSMVWLYYLYTFYNAIHKSFGVIYFRQNEEMCEMNIDINKTNKQSVIILMMEENNKNKYFHLR